MLARITTITYLERNPWAISCAAIALPTTPDVPHILARRIPHFITHWQVEFRNVQLWFRLVYDVRVVERCAPDPFLPPSVFQTKKPMKQTVQFLPVVFTSDGGSFVERGCSPSPSPIPGVAALRSSSPPPSAISSSSTISPSVPLCLERPGVTPRPFSKKGHKTPMKRAGKGFMGKKAADQASKMRDRQKRFDALFVFAEFLSYTIPAHSTVDTIVRI